MRPEILSQATVKISPSDISAGSPGNTTHLPTSEKDNLTHAFKNKIQDERHVLVVGGAGYVGSVLVRKLISKGYRVRILDNLLYNNASSIHDLMEEERLSFVAGDFGNNEAIGNALNNVTDVVLLAALVGDPICKKYPDLARKTNLMYPKKLIQKMNGKNIQKFIFTSTCSNYGLRKDDSLANEDSELNPQSLYAETKVEFERYITENLNEIDYSPTILRLSTAFGMSGRMRFDLTIAEFTKDLALGKKLVVYDENTWRPYCNVSDISDAILKVIEAPKEKVFGQVFNIGSDNNNYTKIMILDLINKYITHSDIEYKQGGGDPRNYRVSFNKVKNVLDFETKYTAEISIQHLVKAIENKIFSDVESRTNFYGNYFINE